MKIIKIVYIALISLFISCHSVDGSISRNLKLKAEDIYKQITIVLLEDTCINGLIVHRNEFRAEGSAACDYIHNFSDSISKYVGDNDISLEVIRIDTIIPGSYVFHSLIKEADVASNYFISVGVFEFHQDLVISGIYMTSNEKTVDINSKVDCLKSTLFQIKNCNDYFVSISYKKGVKSYRQNASTYYNDLSNLQNLEVFEEIFVWLDSIDFKSYEIVSGELANTYLFDGIRITKQCEDLDSDEKIINGRLEMGIIFDNDSSVYLGCKSDSLFLFRLDTKKIIEFYLSELELN